MDSPPRIARPPAPGTVGVTVDEVEEFDALTLSVGIIKAAFYTAAIGTAELVPHDLRCRVVPLQPA